MNFKDSETRKNLLKAFAGESQARNRYTYFAGAARKDGFPTIANIFEETAGHEREHAERFFKFLDSGEMLEITASYPAGKIGTTLENLVASANGEHEEWSELYPGFAKKAREEGFEVIAKTFDNIAVAETYHDDRFSKLIEDLKSEGLFKKKDLVVWKCTNCGYHIQSVEAPMVCPACAHKREYFIETSGVLF
ncbi:MAG: rubrerythrin family protein [Rickettsiales bacterium]|jgi:rubrerythrin|nr:rubrerythrin family protein [Rickettsiales bacterium]